MDVKCSLRCGHRPLQTGRTMMMSQLRWGVGWKRWWQEELSQKSKRFIVTPCREVSRGMGAVGKSRSRSHLWEGLKSKVWCHIAGGAPSELTSYLQLLLAVTLLMCCLSCVFFLLMSSLYNKRCWTPYVVTREQGMSEWLCPKSLTPYSLVTT